MWYTRIVPCVLVAALVIGCNEQSPLMEAEEETIATPLFAASGGWTEFEFPIDAIIFVPCANDGAGEDMHFLGTCRIQEKVVETPSGNTNLNWRPVSCYDYTVTGLVTNDVYTLRRDTFAKLNWNSGKGEVWVQVEHFVMTNVDTGERIDFPLLYHFTINANGELTAEVENAYETCRAHKN